MLRVGKRLVERRIERLFDLAEQRQRTAPATKVALRKLLLEYRRAAAEDAPIPSVWDTGFRVFSQFDEDGVILFLLGVAGMGTRRFVDIGAGDGVYASNCANLALNLGFHGLFIDARAVSIERARRFYENHPDTAHRPPRFARAFVNRENVNDIVSGAALEGDIDLLSIDIDGNEFWVWEALACVKPRFVVVEAHTELGLDDWVMPYDANFDWRSAPRGDPIGASPVALTKLAGRLGYRLVGANLYGFNLFYAREDVGARVLPTIEVAELFRHGSYGP